jgi:hypothetical protein
MMAAFNEFPGDGDYSESARKVDSRKYAQRSMLRSRLRPVALIVLAATTVFAAGSNFQQNY